MIHLRTFSTAWNKSVLKSFKSPLSTSRFLAVLPKPECTSSVTQLLRFLSVEGRSVEPRTNAEDDTSKEVPQTVSKFSISTENLDKDISTGRVEEKYVNENIGRSESRVRMNVEDFRISLKEADMLRVGEAVKIIHRFCGLFGSRYFPVVGICRFKNVESFISPNDLNGAFETVEKNLRFIKTTSLLKVFEACTILNISDDSSLMQKVIKLLSLNINSLSSLEVVHIYCIIDAHYHKKSHIDALRVACQEFFKYYFENRIYPSSASLGMSRYVCYENLPVNVRECFIRKVFENRHNLPLWSCTNMLRGLSLRGVFEYNEFHEECVNYILEQVQRNLNNNFVPIEIFHFLRSYKFGVLNRRISYNEGFLDILALNFVNCNLPLSTLLESCRCFFQMSHFNYALFDYVTSKVADDLNSAEFKLNPGDFFTLIKVLSGSGKQTKIMNSSFKKKLEAACLLLPKYVAEVKIQLPLNLAVLGIYEDSLLEHCFTSENGQVLTKEDVMGFNEFTQNMLLLLHQAVVTFHPSYQEPLLSEKLIEKLGENHYVVSPTHNVWQGVVESCFGGPNFVMKNCKTSLNHNLSYVVVLDKDNVPIDVASIQGTNTTDLPFNIADIPTAEETKVIVLQDVWTEGHVAFRNVSSWKGHFQLYLDVLEAYCNGVVPLLISEFNSLKGSERVPFLLSKIEKKFGVIGKPISTESET